MQHAVRRPPFNIQTRTWLQVAALAFAVLAAWPLLQTNGLLNTRGGGDSPFLLQRVHQLVVALADGHFPVRWMPDAAYGYGYPFFNYYAALSIYVAALFRFLGFSYVRAIQLAQLLGFLVAAWAVFQLALRWFENHWVGFLAAVAYTFAPFHLINVYVRGDSLAEFWAMALYPLVVLTADNLGCGLQRNGGRGDTQKRPIALLGLSYAALVLSHNISALIFSPFVLFYVLLRTRHFQRKRQQFLLQSGLALILGLALSAWFWLPALAEKSLVQTAPVTQGYFHYQNHFWGANLVQPFLFFNYDVASRGAFRMGLVQALLTLGGVVVLVWWWRRQRQQLSGHPSSGHPLVFVFLLLVVSTWMITPLSRVLWDNLPLLPYVQFPWRFLSIQALAGALTIGALGLLPVRRIVVPVVAAFIAFTMLAELRVDHLVLADGDVTAERLAQYEWFTGNIGSTVSAEYLPSTVDPRPYSSPWLISAERNWVQTLEGRAAVALSERRATHQTWQLDVHSETAVLELPTYYWPGWQATLDGKPATVAAAAHSGLITVTVPSGDHRLVLYLDRTPVRRIAEWLSLLGLLICVVLFVPVQRASLRQRLRPAIGAVAIGFIVLLGALLLSRLCPRPSFTAGMLNWDFAEMGYLHHAPGGIGFDDGLSLTAYRYSADTVAPGEKLRIELAWRNLDEVDGEEVSLALVTPAVYRHSLVPELVSQAQPLGASVYELSIPENSPPGLYVPRLRRETLPVTPSGKARGELFLRPVRILATPQQSNEVAALQVRLDSVDVVGRMPEASGTAEGLYDCAGDRQGEQALQLQLAWLTAEPLPQNYTVSLRLTDPAGLVLAQCDMQPGYGFLPSGSWPVGQWVPDWLALPLPQQLPKTSHYVLLVTLYEQPGKSIFTRRLGEFTWHEEALAFRETELTRSLPPDIELLTVRFDQLAALRGYQMSYTGDELTLTLYWEALRPGQKDYVRFVHLIEPSTQEIVTQVDSMPRNNTYPTGQWIAGEIVDDMVTLDLADVPPGRYQLAIGFYATDDSALRLPVLDGQGQPLPDGRFLLPLALPE